LERWKSLVTTDSTTKFDAGSVSVYMAMDSVTTVYAVQPYDPNYGQPQQVVTTNIMAEPTDERAIRLKILEVLERLTKLLDKQARPKRVREHRPMKTKKGKRKNK